MFYERYLQLCEAAKIAPSAAATMAGFNRGTVSVWKKKYETGQDVVPEHDIIKKYVHFLTAKKRGCEVYPSKKKKRPPQRVSVRFRIQI